jgi:hypothetical protein
MTDTIKALLESALVKEALALHEENRDLREVLAFYANKKNYEYEYNQPTCDCCGPVARCNPPIDDDNEGEKARAVLAKYGRE